MMLEVVGWTWCNLSTSIDQPTFLFSLPQMGEQDHLTDIRGIGQQHR